MPEEKVVYKDAIKNLLDAFRARIGPRVRERMRAEAGVDENELKPSYRLAMHDAVVKILAEELYPGRPLDEATYEVGRAMLDNYERARFKVSWS